MRLIYLKRLNMHGFINYIFGNIGTRLLVVIAAINLLIWPAYNIICYQLRHMIIYNENFIPGFNIGTIVLIALYDALGVIAGLLSYLIILGIFKVIMWIIEG
jgi:hypothetical protein